MRRLIILRADLIFAMEGSALDRKVCAKRQTAEAPLAAWQRIKEVYLKTMGERDAGILATMVVGDRGVLDAETKRLYQIGGLSLILAISGVKTLKLDIPLVPETRINWAFVPLHIAIIYILKLCLDEEIIPRCRFPCSRGYPKMYKLAKEVIIQRKSILPQKSNKSAKGRRSLWHIKI